MGYVLRHYSVFEKRYILGGILSKKLSRSCAPPLPEGIRGEKSRKVPSVPRVLRTQEELSRVHPK